MPSLKLVGPTPTATTSIATRKKIDDVITGLVTPADMQARVAAAVAPYATKTYVDTQDGLLSTKAYVDAQDALYIPNTWKGAVNGVAENVSSAIPTSRYPQVPTGPVLLSKTWRNTDFIEIPPGSAAGTTAWTILNTNLPMSTNSTNFRFMAFGNFEAWPANVGNYDGKPVFCVYINNFLCGMGIGRNGAGHTQTTHVPVYPCGDDLGHTPGTGWNSSTLNIRVTLGSAFANTAVSYGRSVFTYLTVYLVGP